jgi:hypothetical protein
VVGAGDDELGEGPGGERVQRDVGLPRAALHGERAGTLLQLWRQWLRRVELRADRVQEAAQEDLRVGRRARRIEQPASLREVLDDGDSGGDPRGRRLDDRERSDRLRPARRCEQRDDASVGVPDEVVSGLEQSRDELRVRLEVDALDGRIRGKARPLEDHELELAGERSLGHPRRATADDAAVHEHEALHEAIVSMSRSTLFFAFRKQSWCHKQVDMLRPDDPGRGPITALARDRLGAAARRACRGDARRRARRMGTRLGGDRAPGRRDRRDPTGRARRVPGLWAQAGAVSAGIFSTPRAVPSRLGPTVAGATVLALALPIFAVAGWPLAGWLLAAVLWAAAEIFAFVLARLPGRPDNLAAAGMRGIGTTSRALLVGVVLVIVTVSNESVGLGAALLYAVVFTVELGIGLATYFGGEANA